MVFDTPTMEESNVTKRELIIVATPASTLLHVEWDGGGEVPDMLKGQFTSPMEAQNAIARYLDSKDRAQQEVVLMKKDDEAKQAPVQK